jgi:hypothetical protein
MRIIEKRWSNHYAWYQQCNLYMQKIFTTCQLNLAVLPKKLPDAVPLVPEDNCSAILSLCMLSLEKETIYYEIDSSSCEICVGC